MPWANKNRLNKSNTLATIAFRSILLEGIVAENLWVDRVSEIYNKTIKRLIEQHSTE